MTRSKMYTAILVVLVVLGATALALANLSQSDVCTNANDTNNCTPTGNHGLIAPGYNGAGGHAGFDCKVCHYVGGRLAFEVNGPAYGPSLPAPYFDATAKTCSNIACHGVPAGTFSYYFPGNETDPDGYPIPELKTVTVYGNPGGTTPSWYTTGSGGCSGCHSNPPANGTSGSNVWHSGSHANNQNVGPTPPNACALCHNAPANVNSPIAQSEPIDLTKPYGAYRGVSPILILTLHGNSVYNVNARFRSQCFGCH